MRTTTVLFTIILMTLHTSQSQAQKEIPLYDGAIPNSHPVHDHETRETGKDTNRISLSYVSTPTLALFLPEHPNGAAVVICPGGGYTHLAIGHEGYEIARKLNEQGVAAFVLKYRLPNDTTMKDKQIGPLQDAQRAIQLVRQHSEQWGVNPTRIGLMGFSAGGHLASTAGTHFATSYIPNADQITLRPDFLILLYPVISMADSITHHGSRDNLLGLHPTSEEVEDYSNELWVSATTPPTFLVHAGDDRTVPIQNTLLFYEALQRRGVPAEMHVYPSGGHGFGLHNSTTKEEWFDLLINWMDSNGWMK